MLKKSNGKRFHQQGFIFSTFPINFIICLTPYRKASITGAFFIKESEDDMGVRVVFPDMGKDPSIQLIEKTITENGTYDAITDGANGYSKVNVNVEGGGGSSDFSTAEVTISGANGEEATVLLMPNIQDSDRRTGIEPAEVRASFTQKTYNVPLFKGHCLIKVDSGDVDGLTGNVTLNRGWLDVTGNCSLTGYYVQN